MQIKKRMSIKIYLYSIFIIAVIFIAISTIAITYKISTKQLNNYYDKTAKENAYNVSTFLDGDYLKKLQKTIDTPEYQEIRQEAEDTQNEELIIEYLKEKEVWNEFYTIRTQLTQYLKNMSTIRYLYIVAYDPNETTKDMYLIDDEDTELYEVGYYETREKEFDGYDLANLDHSILNNSETWGWLYSTYAPVYDSNGDCVALVGCDIELTYVIAERHRLLFLMIGWIVVSTIAFIILILITINQSIVKPIEIISVKTKEFKPQSGMTQDDDSIINIQSKKENEITDIANAIKKLELDTIDYITSLNLKDTQIQQLSRISTRDGLTGVGNVYGYKNKINELSINFQNNDFALLMADINNLKIINDTYGHKEGDKYIQSCCKILCDTFKHSSVYRIGGDEFVVVIQREDYDNRNMLYAKLKLIFDHNFFNMEAPVNKRYSMSIGIGEKKEDDITFDRMFREADRMMYDNKRKIKSAENDLQ